VTLAPNMKKGPKGPFRDTQLAKRQLTDQ
jgi:hypothetical protein